MRRIVLSMFALFAVLQTETSSAAVIDLTAKCANWEYTSDGGPNGGEPTAFVNCNDTSDDTPVNLQIICHGHSLSIRYKGAQKNVGTERAELTYKFRRGTYTDNAKFEPALDEWVIYKSSMDLEHPLFGAFSESLFVDVKLHDGGFEERIPLSNSRVSIAKVMKSCARIGILASFNQVKK